MLSKDSNGMVWGRPLLCRLPSYLSGIQAEFLRFELQELNEEEELLKEDEKKKER